MAPLVIELTGNSSITRTAERGVLHISVSSTGKSQKTVSEEVTQTCNLMCKTFDDLTPQTIESLIRADGNDIQLTTDTFQTNSSVPRDREGKLLQREYTASIKFTAIFGNCQKLGEATSLLFGMPYVEIESTEWRLTDATIESLGPESRKLAMRDAMRKANDFAEVVGRIPVAIEVRDNGGHAHGVALPRFSSNSRRSAAAKQRVHGSALTSQRVQWKTSINVKFRADSGPGVVG